MWFSNWDFLTPLPLHSHFSNNWSVSFLWFLTPPPPEVAAWFVDDPLLRHLHLPYRAKHWPCTTTNLFDWRFIRTRFSWNWTRLYLRHRHVRTSTASAPPAFFRNTIKLIEWWRWSGGLPTKDKTLTAWKILRSLLLSDRLWRRTKTPEIMSKWFTLYGIRKTRSHRSLWLPAQCRLPRTRKA